MPFIIGVLRALEETAARCVTDAAWSNIGALLSMNAPCVLRRRCHRSVQVMEKLPGPSSSSRSRQFAKSYSPPCPEFGAGGSCSLARMKPLALRFVPAIPGKWAQLVFRVTKDTRLGWAENGRTQLYRTRQGAHSTACRTVLKGRRSGAPCKTDLGIGCAAKTSKSLSLSKSRPERSSKSDNVIWSTEKRPGSNGALGSAAPGHGGITLDWSI